jgi:transcriptional regulator with XRE-family HTH domain
MSAQPFGCQLRTWRQRRRLSQLELATHAEISSRHLSFIETGRSSPSRDMVLHLAARLEVPPRERNQLLVAAGFAPVFPERPLDDPALTAVRRAIDLVLEAHRPYPAFAVDRTWNIVASNHALPEMYVGVDPALLVRPVNALRLALHPGGLAPRIENHAQWRAHLLHDLQRQIELTADPALVALMTELSAYPAPPLRTAVDPGAMIVPLRLRVGDTSYALFSTTMVFGTPVDVTVSELAVELFFPADAATAARLERVA